MWGNKVSNYLYFKYILLCSEMISNPVVWRHTFKNFKTIEKNGSCLLLWGVKKITLSFWMFFYISFDTFLSWKKYPKTAFQFYKELFTFRFTPQKPRINVELHAFFFQKQCFFFFISLRFGTQFRSIYRLVLCKIEVIASKFEILDLF